ncbi:MBOAT family protein [bacterium]|nr:MBOAT family protein [bacterium]
MFILIASCIFYGCWDWSFLGLLLLTSLSTFITGRCMEKGTDRQRRIALIGSIALNVGILFVFKYFNFFIEAFVDLFALCGIELNASTLKLLLPVGISFYTFTALSYTIDVYQKKIEPTKDWLAYLCYVTFFPSILSGPINRATKQLPQFFQLRTFNYDMVSSGTKMLVWGLFVKLCVADRLGIYVDTVYGNLMQHTGVTLFVTSIIYTLQIYADFSGYSLMAIGLGKMLGIELQTNFIRPYLAKTVTDFWRRWHISLTTWFRDYIYFPLGGNRCSKGRWMLNTMIVFVVSGLWHGAAYTFLIWGAFHGLCMIVEKQVYGDKLKQMSNRMNLANGLRMCLTFMVVNLAWIFFRLDGVDNAIYTVAQIATIGGGNSFFLDKTTLGIGLVSFFLMLLKDVADEYDWNIKLLNSSNAFVSGATIVALICYILLFGVLNGGSFIYFQF